MNKNIFKWIIVVIAILAIIIGIMYLIDFNRMKNGEEEQKKFRLRFA